MSADKAGCEVCGSYINCQYRNERGDGADVCFLSPAPVFVTISREAGTNAMALASRLAAYLQEHDTEAICPWQVFNKTLILNALESHHQPGWLAESLPEDKVSEIDALMMELFGGHPSISTLLKELEETILKLADRGNVILVGRASNVITAKLPGGVHVRLVGSVEKRLERLRTSEGFTGEEAAPFLRKEDRARARFVRTYFNADIQEPLEYDLVINTDRMSVEESALMIAGVVLERHKKKMAKATALSAPIPSMVDAGSGEMKD
ncbi:MAG: cytidylate kinase-like family protein [Verrucomicrobiae bacterium]|nr:cytidylate kinase-like family protein [Verrucomicrobiae bacterium]